MKNLLFPVLVSLAVLGCTNSRPSAASSKHADEATQSTSAAETEHILLSSVTLAEFKKLLNVDSNAKHDLEETSAEKPDNPMQKYARSVADELSRTTDAENIMRLTRQAHETIRLIKAMQGIPEFDAEKLWAENSANKILDFVTRAKIRLSDAALKNIKASAASELRPAY